MQYSEKKRNLADIRNALGCQQYSDMPHGTDVGNPTERAAMRAAKLSADTELIEQTAIETDSGIYQYIILAVTNEGVTYNILRELKQIPCSKRYYYTRRRRFFYLLAQKRNVI